MTKYVALYDMHFGYEIRTVDGKKKKSPTHSLASVKAVFNFMEDFKPDTVILGGDQVEFGAISHHNNGKPRLVEGLRLTDDMDLLNTHVLTPLEFIESIKKKVWLTGNHENRVERYLNEHPGAEGIIEPENYLSLKKRGWIIQPEEVPYQIGKLNFVHGHSIFANGSGPNPAKKLAYHYRRNIIAGHLHTHEVATDITPADREDFHCAVISPALCVASPEYMKNRPSNFQRGFVYGYVRQDGNFNNYIAILTNNKFTVNGTTYGN